MEKVIAIGECGLDRRSPIGMKTQEEILAVQVGLAEALRKPLIIHCVKAYSELIAVKRRTGSSVPWIVHGYNNNEQILRQLLNHGLYISVGAALLDSRSNAFRLLRMIPAERLFLENDDKEVEISVIYEAASAIFEVDVEVLKEITRNNYNKVFGNSMDWLSRTELLLLGKERLGLLKKAHVLVAGLGGVGAYAAEQLCRAGIGEMTIIDGDRVEVTNKNRQLPALDSNIGKAKAEVMAARFRDINPDIQLHVINDFIKDDRMIDILEMAKYDYVVDAIDTLAPKIFLIYHSLQKGYRVVSSMGAGGKMDPEQIRIADISKSYNCNLARMLRKRLHKLGVYKGVKVVFSPEEVDPEAVVLSESENKKSNVGTISYMPPLFGCFCASVVIRDITNPI